MDNGGARANSDLLAVAIAIIVKEIIITIYVFKCYFSGKHMVTS